MLGTSLTPNPNQPGTTRILGCELRILLSVVFNCLQSWEDEHACACRQTSLAERQLVAISAATTQSGYGLSRSQVSWVRQSCDIMFSFVRQLQAHARLGGKALRFQGPCHQHL